jgi:hypothetical protein
MQFLVAHTYATTHIAGPTGGWGSLEYSQAQVGSVLGGRWKVLHYFFRRTLFTDQFATCGVASRGANGDNSVGRARASVTHPFLCGIVNDSPWAFHGQFSLKAISLTQRGNGSTTLKTLPLVMGAAGFSEWHNVTIGTLDPTTTVLVATISNSSAHVVHENLIPLTSPENLRLRAANVTAVVTGLTVTVSTDWPALWVVLTCAAHGRFEDNAFLLRGSRTIDFVPFVDEQEEVLRQTIRVEHVGQHIL